MNLVDLPPEIFGKVIAHYVTKVRVCEAWKSRQTCRTFASFISVEILARQPTKAFKESRRSEKLLHRQLAKYLVYRCRSLQSANPVLPQFVCGMAKRFMHSIEDDSETMRDHFISAISYAIGRHPIAVDKLIWNPRPVTMAKTFGSGGAEHDVAAAIAIGNTEVFLAVVVGKDQCLFKKSVIFGNPLAMAAGKGEIRMVEAVLDVAMRFPPEDELARHQFLASGIDCALDRSFYDTAIFILLRYREYLGSAFPLPRPSFDNWIIAAINGNSEDVVKVILEINSDQRRIQSSVLQKFIIRLRGSPLIKQMLNTGRTNMKPAFKRRWSTKFLDDAARAHNVDAVRGFSIMAQILMAMNITGVVRVLLERGANPESCYDPQGRLPEAVGTQKKYGQIRKLLEKAKRKFQPPGTSA